MENSQYLERIILLESDNNEILNRNIVLTKEIGELREVIEKQNLEIYKYRAENQNMRSELDLMKDKMNKIDYNAKMYELIKPFLEKNFEYLQKLESDYLSIMKNLNTFKMLYCESQGLKHTEDSIDNLNKYSIKNIMLDENFIDDFQDEKLLNKNENKKSKYDVDVDEILKNRNIVYATKKQKKAILKMAKIKNYDLKEDINFIPKKDAGILIGYLKGAAKNVKEDFLDKYLEKKENLKPNIKKESGDFSEISSSSNLVLENKSNIDKNIKKDKMIITLADKVKEGYKPVGIRVCNDYINTGVYWNDVIIKLNEYLCDIYKSEYDNIILNNRKIKGIDKYFSNNKAKLDEPVQIGDSSVFFSKYVYHAGTAMEVIRDLSQIFAIENQDIKIYLVKED